MQVAYLYKFVGCTEGDVRLQNGRNTREGRVEVCRNNAWGRVCSSSWGTNDAKVVCRELGYTSLGIFCSNCCVSVLS